MIFFFKRSTITVDCFTSRKDVYDFSPVDYSNKFYPEWWKKLDKQVYNSFYPEATMKTCEGFIQNYQTGFIVPLWSDLSVRLGSTNSTDYNWQYADEISVARIHSVQQRGTYLPPDLYSHIKHPP